MRTIVPTACIGIIALGLLGCGAVDPPYSQFVKYTLRTDPLVLSDKLIDEKEQPHDPDRPGVLPLRAIADLSDPLNPFHAKKAVWLKDSLLRNPRDVSPEDRAALEDRLTEIFGTPANPTVGVISEEQRETLKIDSRTLERGSVLYRVHCLHCHGVTGDGRGPTARWINPHPRDYRQGLFKFQSVDQTEAPRPPRRSDLHRVIKYGIEGTAMPSFALLGDGDVDLMVSYVIHLSIRGKVEYETFKGNFDLDDNNQLVQNPDPNRTLDRFLVGITKIVANEWLDSQAPEREIKIAPYPYKEGDKKALRESVQRGQEMFQGLGVNGKAAACMVCHIDYGRQAKFRSDAWGTLARPNNLTQGIYRGGRRTIDIYYRIHSGINGSGMASFGKALKGDSLWDLVNFVKVLPYPAMRKEYGIDIDAPVPQPAEAPKVAAN